MCSPSPPGATNTGKPVLKKKSPSVKQRDRQRMISFNYKKKEDSWLKEKYLLEQKIDKIQKELDRKSTIFPNTKKPHLTTSITSLTNFPEPCQVCKLNECRYDLAHELSFTIRGAAETAIEKINCNRELEKVLGELNWKAEPPVET